MDINSYAKFCSLQYVSRETYEKLEIFYKTLIKWQKSINLISNSSLEHIWTRHVVESDQRKCTFMREVARLSNTNLKIHNCRIEDLQFINPDLIVCRALAPLNKLIEYVENHMHKNNLSKKNIPNLLFLKGKLYNDELNELKKVRKFEFKVYPSVTNEYGKILFISNLAMS